MSGSFVPELQRERARLLAEREKLDGQIAGIDIALRVFERTITPGSVVATAALSGTSVISANADIRAPRDGSVKEYVMKLVAEFPDGLGSRDLLAEAAKRNRELNRNTVTSLLSANASKGLLEFANGRYRIPKGIPEVNATSGSQA